jgi:hypothetical protein
VSLPIDQQDLPARWIAADGDTARSGRPAWLRWCYAMIDSAFDLDLNDAEVKFLSDAERRE